ncbi:SCO family protein [Seleniivibrio woodruffii]|uniref:SCO family protein n=1 Tax=Seleniivibrio woodruffii TaxID=1078050 RepID=UPI0026EF794D|nr:SCO family protein [Seleniivibrio woodruffii]
MIKQTLRFAGIFLAIVCLAGLVAVRPVFAADGEKTMEHMHHEDAPAEDNAQPAHEHVHKDPAPQEKANVGVTEHLGSVIPLDLEFQTSDGRTVTLKDIVDKPTLFAPVYYSCPNVCNFLQSRLADIIPQVKMKAGETFQVVSVSFDEFDTPETAAEKKVNYMKAAGGTVPDSGWIFLTGSKENIDKLMNALGFRFQRKDRDFLHPVAVISVSKSGKIVRYLYGTDILPFEMTMAVVEAEKETPGLSVKKLVAYCFSYDPQGKKYVFDVMKVSGIVVLLVIAMFASYLFFGGKKRKKRGSDEQ